MLKPNATLFGCAYYQAPATLFKPSSFIFICRPSTISGTVESVSMSGVLGFGTRDNGAACADCAR